MGKRRQPQHFADIELNRLLDIHAEKLENLKHQRYRFLQAHPDFTRKLQSKMGKKHAPVFEPVEVMESSIKTGEWERGNWDPLLESLYREMLGVPVECDPSNPIHVARSETHEAAMRVLEQAKHRLG